jgi:hypothetical protein
LHKRFQPLRRLLLSMMAFACSPFEMPNPTITGGWVWAFASFINLKVVFGLVSFEPVTPSRLTR